MCCVCDCDCVASHCTRACVCVCVCVYVCVCVCACVFFPHAARFIPLLHLSMECSFCIWHSHMPEPFDRAFYQAHPPPHTATTSGHAHERHKVFDQSREDDYINTNQAIFNAVNELQVSLSSSQSGQASQLQDVNASFTSVIGNTRALVVTPTIPS